MIYVYSLINVYALVSTAPVFHASARVLQYHSTPTSRASRMLFLAQNGACVGALNGGCDVSLTRV